MHLNALPLVSTLNISSMQLETNVAKNIFFKSIWFTLITLVFFNSLLKQLLCQWFCSFAWDLCWSDRSVIAKSLYVRPNQNPKQGFGKFLVPNCRTTVLKPFIQQQLETKSTNVTSKSMQLTFLLLCTLRLPWAHRCKKAPEVRLTFMWLAPVRSLLSTWKLTGALIRY